jgi:hypothetical protein
MGERAVGGQVVDGQRRPLGPIERLGQFNESTVLDERPLLEQPVLRDAELTAPVDGDAGPRHEAPALLDRARAFVAEDERRPRGAVTAHAYCVRELVDRCRVHADQAEAVWS